MTASLKAIPGSLRQALAKPRSPLCCHAPSPLSFICFAYHSLPSPPSPLSPPPLLLLSSVSPPPHKKPLSISSCSSLPSPLYVYKSYSVQLAYGHLGGFLFGAMGIGLPIRTPNRGHLWCPCSVGEAVVSVLLALPPGQRSCSQTHFVGGPVWRDLSLLFRVYTASLPASLPRLLSSCLPETVKCLIRFRHCLRR